MSSNVTPVAVYKRQLEAGFANLRFTPALEAGFLEDFRERRMRFTRTGLVLAAGFYSAFLVVKLVFDEPDAFLYWTSGLRLAMITAMLATARWVSRVQGNARDRWVIGNYFVFALSLTMIEVLTVRYGYQQNYEGMIFVIFHACLFGGLLLRPCLTIVATMTIGYVTLGNALGIHSSAMGFQAFFLVLACIMGAVGVYLNEHAERDNYLRRHLMNASANFDELTGLASRSAFDRYLKLYLRRIAGATPQPQAIVLVDLDHFKLLNDSRGHDSGDKCLQLVAEILKRCIDGPAKSVGRWGGDELIAVLPAPDEDELYQRVESIRQEVELMQMENPDTATGTLTVSIGVLIVQPEQRLEEKMLFRQTDAALYEAKQAGRNRVVLQHACAQSTMQTIPPKIPA